MKYYVTHRCGHEEMVELFGKGSERERRIARMEAEECPECRARLAAERDEAKGYAALKGTPKQVAWASDIREKMLERVAADVRRRIQGYNFDWTRGQMPENVTDNYFGAQILDSTILDVLRGIRDEHSASWFIDHQNAGLAELSEMFEFTSYDEQAARYCA